MITTKPLISKYLIELWKRDTGSVGQVMENTVATTRRTVRLEIDHLEDGTYRVTPKVLVERQSILERRVTSAIEYHSIFAGPASLQSRTSVASDIPDEVIPIRYFTPLYRDKPLEKKMAKTIHDLLKKQGQEALLRQS